MPNPGSKKRKRELVLKTAGQVRALRTPLRQEMVHAMGRLGSCSVKELASELRRAPAALYYHVHALEEAGIVRKSGQRSAGTQTEGVYELSAERVVLDRKARSRGYTSALADIHRTTLRAAERELVRSLEHSARLKESPADSMAVLRLSARLGPSDQARVREMLLELAEFIGERDDPEASAEFALTTTFVKLAPRDASR